MPANTFSLCCVQGKLHDGEASGVIKKQFGINAYVTGEDYGDARNIVIFSDVFGIGLKNNLLIADCLADAGYRVYIPDIFDGDAIKVESMSNGFDPEAFAAWKKRHDPVNVASFTQKFLDDLRQSVGDSKYIATIGHCYGAGFVLRSLAEGGGADAGAVAHPSFVSGSLFEGVTKPLLISAAENDNAFARQDRVEAEIALHENGIKYQITVFSGVSHGYAVRGDMSDLSVKYAKEKTLMDQISWINHFLR
ncbi:CIC11C00000001292 [Sungouiella intermedia]|uniref:CIC11C00000001292 n=1 Tax=Sungouiella intermedia TaxID=45354 RepID=A0A1L0BTM7_9ASCO|nr:CIC11C00000001292 [[Candida] intermedia]